MNIKKVSVAVVCTGYCYKLFCDWSSSRTGKENHGIAQNLSVEFGIPWEAVMAQSIVESTAGTSYFATMRNNFFGLGAYDSNPDNAYYYDNLEAGWRGYFELIQQNYKTYGAKGVFTKEVMTDPYKYLEAIKAAGYATDPNYVAKVSNYIDYVVARSMQLGWLSSAELAESN
jgi:flagellum-specific peptidoglycan hydrolase FlgJ